jgi:Cd2+/Zn2+-exporting ATPase
MSREEQRKGGQSGIWVLMALALGATIIVATLLDLFQHGVPLGFNLPLANEPATLSRVIYYLTVATASACIGFVGLRELLVERRFSVEFLMSVAALGATYLGLLFEAATVLLLYSLAQHFEGYIEDRARKAVEKLTQFMPDKVTLLIDNEEKRVDVREAQPGTTMLLKPGERVPLDGIVVEGNSTVDQSLVTGESTPVQKKPDDFVFAGTMNLNGLLKAVVNKSAQDTLVSRIVNLVLESKKRKASVEKLVDKFARIYIPLVISTAALTALLIPRIVGGPFETWLYRSLIFLVVSCPSAFVISVPATIFMAVAIAARKGIIVKGGIFIEKAAEVRAVIFDKTGTLTLGEPTVHNVNSIEEVDERALAYAAALEQFSSHPMAQAIVKKAAERKLDYDKLEVTEVKEVPGKGLTGKVDNAQVIVGNMDLLIEHSCNCDEINEVHENDKHAFMCVAVNKSAIATICVTDEVREDALRTVRELRDSGTHTVMLTGDKREIAMEIGERLGMDEVRAELLPEDKLKALSETRAKYGKVAMVGDGINDAPALAASDVGIAMGGRSVDIALESADIVLVKDKLAQVPYLIRMSGQTVRIAKQNIVVSIGVKIILGALGLVGLIPLWFTVASGDDGLTSLVLLNTLRLTRVKT